MMSQLPRIQALTVVKNESDIIELCLKHASQFCTNIFVIDHASTDGTWDIVRQTAQETNVVVPVGREEGEELYWSLYPVLVREARTYFQDGDWIYVLDADEFLERDPRPLLATCAERGEDTLRCMFAQFLVTELDLDTPWFNSKGPVGSFSDLPRHYRIDWEENRFYRYSPSVSWPLRDPDGSIRRTAQPSGHRKISGDRVLSRHYQYRSRHQMIRRLQIRAQLSENEGVFSHNTNPDWRSYVHSHSNLKRAEPNEKIEATLWEAIRCRWRRNRPIRRLIRRVRRILV